MALPGPAAGERVAGTGLAHSCTPVTPISPTASLFEEPVVMPLALPPLLHLHSHHLVQVII